MIRRKIQLREQHLQQQQHQFREDHDGNIQVELVFTNQFPHQEKKKLCIYSQFKNEKHILLEWIRHYQQEGADHIILVDNQSDDGFHPQMIRHIPNLTLFSCKMRHSQTKIAKHIFKHCMEGRFEWATSIDMDEFIYTRRFPTLSDHLNHVDIHHGERKSLVVPWKVFGSNGHIQQPPNVIDQFVARDWDCPGDQNSRLVKTIFKPEFYHVAAHIVLTKEQNQYSSFPHAEFVGGKPIPGYTMDPFFHEMGLNLNEAEIHLNHYQIQSLDYFQRVKQKRGDADHNNWDHIRDLNYFQNRDRNYLTDTELSDKKKLKKPDLLLLIPDGYMHAEFHISRYRRFLSAVHFRQSRKEDLGLLPSILGNWKKENVMMVMSLLEEPGPSQWKQFEFVLERTLLTGKTVRLKPMGGHPRPETHIFAKGTEEGKYERIYYDEKRLGII